MCDILSQVKWCAFKASTILHIYLHHTHTCTCTHVLTHAYILPCCCMDSCSHTPSWVINFHPGCRCVVRVWDGKRVCCLSAYLPACLLACVNTHFLRRKTNVFNPGLSYPLFVSRSFLFISSQLGCSEFSAAAWAIQSVLCQDGTPNSPVACFAPNEWNLSLINEVKCWEAVCCTSWEVSVM